MRDKLKKIQKTRFKERTLFSVTSYANSTASHRNHRHTRQILLTLMPVVFTWKFVSRSVTALQFETNYRFKFFVYSSFRFYIFE